VTSAQAHRICASGFFFSSFRRRHQLPRLSPSKRVVIPRRPPGNLHFLFGPVFRPAFDLVGEGRIRPPATAAVAVPARPRAGCLRLGVRRIRTGGFVVGAGVHHRPAFALGFFRLPCSPKRNPHIEGIETVSIWRKGEERRTKPQRKKSRTQDQNLRPRNTQEWAPKIVNPRKSCATDRSLQIEIPGSSVGNPTQRISVLERRSKTPYLAVN
jgi:hypothetical protein